MLPRIRIPASACTSLRTHSFVSCMRKHAHSFIRCCMHTHAHFRVYVVACTRMHTHLRRHPHTDTLARSNQGAIKGALSGAASDKVRMRISQALKEAGVQAVVLVATQKDTLRKPEAGMWNFLCDHLSPDAKP
ncbi:hypothetical protein DUNSADRAFT_8604, partial [Dunaliella salina]